MDRMYNFDNSAFGNMESPRRQRNGNLNNGPGGGGFGGVGGGGGGGGGFGGPRRDNRRFSRSRSRSRSRNRSYEREYRRSSNNRDRGGMNHRGGDYDSQDLYRDIINDDYNQEEINFHNNNNRGGVGGNCRKWNHDFDDLEQDRFNNDRGSNGRGRDFDRDNRDRGFDRDNRNKRDNKDFRDNRDNRDNMDNRDNRDNRNNRIHNRDNRDNKDNRDRRDNHSRNRRSRSRNDRDHDYLSDDSDISNKKSDEIPNSTLIAYSLKPHITGADLKCALIQYGMTTTGVRLIRDTKTGASRGFAFVEFSTVEEAERWMNLTQRVIILPDNSRVNLCYCKGSSRPRKGLQTDWYCGKCGKFNFKRRDICFQCHASREDSEQSIEGRDEISNILTKKIMLRNLDALTNEEGVLTAMQKYVPDYAKKITKILISRDPLTQTSRGVCYLNFESLVDSMNVHNTLTTLEPPLRIDDQDVCVSYCIDHENREILPKSTKKSSNDITAVTASTVSMGPMTAAEMAAATSTSVATQYTLEDIPRLAEYSAALYATTPEEQEQYRKYYTEYYTKEITSGQFSNLPNKSQLSETSANSAAAVALAAIQQKQKKINEIETTATQAAAAAANVVTSIKAPVTPLPTVVPPRGNDGKIYPVPDVSLYQYDETSGYYYDPTTGLYYDAHSQYYYNNETGAYLYWDQRKSSYVLATPAAAAATVKDVVKAESSEAGPDTAKATTTSEEDAKKDNGKKEGKHDKVKVAKKIVKDMEKWAKQLNQKKDYTAVATPQPLLTSSDIASTNKIAPASTGYADVCFSILEKKERHKLTDFMTITPASTNKLVSAYGSDSDEERPVVPSKPTAAALTAAASKDQAGEEKDYVDFQKLTCLLCKRAFQSLEILTKHLKMSNLHKENLQKYNLGRASAAASNSDQDSQGASLLSYRDRAKERRLKYGESDSPPPNPTRECFEKEIKTLAATGRKNQTPVLPIDGGNVGNKLLQKMGWTEGQGLGRKNQGRTNIIEANARSSTAGLGNRSGTIPHGDDYKSYIKKMMKTRYESV